MEEDGIYLEDTVKVVLHVQAQKGWDGRVDEGAFELLPLTRPYGLEPGLVFQARAMLPDGAKEKAVTQPVELTLSGVRPEDRVKAGRLVR